MLNVDIICFCSEEVNHTIIVMAMDVRKLELGPGSFDIVLDKGTLDALLVFCFYGTMAKESNSAETRQLAMLSHCWEKFIEC